MLKWME